MQARSQTLVLGTLLSLLCASAVGQSGFQVNFEAVRKSIVFLYARGADGRTQPDGTGFLIGIPSKVKPNRKYIFLVTARHIVDPFWTGCPAKNQGIVARFNKKVFDPKTDESGTVDYDLPGDPLKGFKWIMPNDDSADLAFLLLNAGKIDTLGADYNVIGLNEFPKAVELATIDTGSQILKFGHVSSRPQEKISFKGCPNGREIEASEWMIAASLVPGNSGSPILYVPTGAGNASAGPGRAVVIGVQSTSFIGWDIAGMAPIQFLIDALKASNLPDLDLSEIEN